MKDQILLYLQMCDAEKVQTLQRGMNYRLNPDYSVILMSQRTNAPYKVFRFILEETEIGFKNNHLHENVLKPRSRVIPTDVKKQFGKETKQVRDLWSHRRATF